MKILWRGFAAKNHSWAIVAQNICRQLKQEGHEVHIFSTNGTQYYPEDLKENLIGYVEENQLKVTGRLPDKEYDLQLSYTAMIHWGEYLSHGNKNRFGIWNYDGTVIPNGWAKHYKSCDKVFPSSKFSFDVFKNNGVPEEVMEVVPHGVAEEFFTGTNKYNINHERKRKILINIAQAHTRKNIPGLFEAWGRAFTYKDDVVLVAKVSMKKPMQQFEVSWMDEFVKMRKKYKKYAPVIIVNNFIPNISDLYRACDIGFSMSNIECFNLPALESMVVGNITIASNYGGNVDFMNENNSLLVKGTIGRAPANFQYWKSSVMGECFYPDVDHAAELLRFSVDNYDSLIVKFAAGREKIKEEYTWGNVTKKIMEQVK